MSTVNDDPTRAWVRGAAVIAVFVGLLWLIEIVDALMAGSLDENGIEPRSQEGLIGIAVAPLLHADWAHLESNSVPLLILGFLVAAASVARLLGVLAFAWVLSGLGVWLLAPPDSITIGASGLVFGLLTYVMVVGFLERRPMGILIGVGVFVLYGSVLVGVLPGDSGVSWQGHLFGAIGGVLTAYFLARRRRPRTPDW